MNTGKSGQLLDPGKAMELADFLIQTAINGLDGSERRRDIAARLEEARGLLDEARLMYAEEENA